MAPRPALACTEIILDDTCTPGGAVVTSRTLSFPASFGPEVVLVRKGAKFALLETSDRPDFPVIDGKKDTKAIEAKYDFVCAAIARNELAGYYGANSTRGRDDWMWCTDGLNGAGLSCAIQYQGLTEGIKEYDPDDEIRKDAINFEDLCTYALARFDSAPDFAKTVNDTTQLVTPAKMYEKWARAMAQGKSDSVPWHMSITDRKGRGVIVQIRNGTTEVVDNRDGVFTNEPFMQEQQKHLDAFEEAMLSNEAKTFPSTKAVMVPELEHGPSVFAPGADAEDAPKFIPFPGDYSGPSRYTRLALVKKYGTEAACWTNNSLIAKGKKEDLNPAYVGGKLPDTNQALLAALGVTNTVYLPRGVSDHGTTGKEIIEWTPLSTLRDHRNDVFYIRAANSPIFKKFDLKKLEWGKLGKSGIKREALTTPQKMWWETAKI